MRTSKNFLIGLITVTFLVSAVGLVQPSPSQADVEFGGIKKILNKFFPPCGPGTRGQRFVVKEEKVCDNKTGLWWQRTPGDPSDGNCGNAQSCEWQEAKDYCTNFELTGKHKKKQWRLPEVEELISLLDYSVPDQATALNAGPFTGVRSDAYWSATEEVGNLGFAWRVFFDHGDVLGENITFDDSFAWCVSGGQDAH